MNTSEVERLTTKLAQDIETAKEAEEVELARLRNVRDRGFAAVEAAPMSKDEQDMAKQVIARDYDYEVREAERRKTDRIVEARDSFKRAWGTLTAELNTETSSED